MTKATLSVRENDINLKIKFDDGIVIHFNESSGGLRLTSSSPELLSEFKTKGEKALAFRELEYKKPELSFLHRLAPESKTIVDLVKNITITY